MLSLVIDIRSDVIEGTLVQFPDKSAKKNKATAQTASQILYATSIKVSQKPNSSPDFLTKKMLKGVEDLAMHIAQEGKNYAKGQIESVHYILSSPWVISQSKTVEINYDKDTEITEALVKNIIDEDRKKLISTFEPDMVFIEQKIFSVELNGYSLEDYQGKHAKSLRVSFAFTLSSDKIIKKIQAIISRVLRIHKEYFHSAILLQYLSSRTKNAVDDKEYMLIHIHGELTDLAVVKKGACAYLGSFPFGVTTFVKKVSHSLRSSIEATESTLAMFTEDKLEDGERKRVETSLMTVLKAWQSECEKAFESIGKDVLLPHTIHLWLNSSYLNFFKGTLEKLGYDVRFDDTPLPQIYISVLGDML